MPAKFIQELGRYVDLGDELDSTSNDLTGSTGTKEDPPASEGKSQVAKVQDEKVIQHSRQFIEGTANLLPTVAPITHGQILSISGVGSQFSGKYYTKSSSYTVNRSKVFTTTVDLRRIGIDLVEEPPQVVQIATRVEKPVVEPVKEKRYHVVTSGDMLSKIGPKYGVPWKSIWELNKEMLIKRDSRNIKSPGHWIYPGQKLEIP